MIANTQVVTAGQLKLRNGAAVEVVEAIRPAATRSEPAAEQEDAAR